MFNRQPRWLRARHRRRLLVHTETGTYDGTLMSSDSGGVELVSCNFVPDQGEAATLAGHIYVPKDQILFIQGVPYASPRR